MFRENLASVRKKSPQFSIGIGVTTALPRWAVHSRETSLMISSRDIDIRKAEKHWYVKHARTSILSTTG